MMSSSKIFLPSYSLKCFFKKVVLYTTVVIKGLCIWYNSSIIRYILCNKPFKAFLKHQMSKDKSTTFLAIKMWNMYVTLAQQIVIFCTQSHLFLLQSFHGSFILLWHTELPSFLHIAISFFYSIFSTSVTNSY